MQCDTLVEPYPHLVVAHALDLVELLHHLLKFSLLLCLPLPVQRQLLTELAWVRGCGRGHARSGGGGGGRAAAAASGRHLRETEDVAHTSSEVVVVVAAAAAAAAAAFTACPLILMRTCVCSPAQTSTTRSSITRPAIMLPLSHSSSCARSWAAAGSVVVLIFSLSLAFVLTWLLP